MKVNSSPRSICGTSQHFPLCDYWHIRPSKSLSTFLGWLLWISLRPVIPILLSFFLFSFNRAPPGGLWTSSSSVSFWCPSRCFGPVLVYLRSCLIRSFTLFHLFTRKAIDNIDLNQISHRYVRGVLQNDSNVLVDFRSLDRSQRGRYIWVSLSYTNGQYCHFQFISLKKKVKSMIHSKSKRSVSAPTCWFSSIATGADLTLRGAILSI